MLVVSDKLDGGVCCRAMEDLSFAVIIFSHHAETIGELVQRRGDGIIVLNTTHSYDSCLDSCIRVTPLPNGTVLKVEAK